uniref:Uncharacterized protein n=1 Tax=uncultured Latescibacterota bacterium TaxID=199737 RepID=Q2Z0C7_9BACT|nr:hypothetical protein [uncultured Latescibacterota bacterium]
MRPLTRRRSARPGARAWATAAVTVVALAAALLVVTGCSCPVPEPAGDETVMTYPTDELPMSSMALIDAAVRSGSLEYSTGLLYKVYVMFEPGSLPPEFASEVPSKCGTPLISEVQRNWNLISQDDRAEISRYIEPIGVPGDSDTQLDDVTPDRLENEREKLD